MNFKPMSHQAESLKFMENKPAILDFSDCGTGKTLVEIIDFAKRHKVNSKITFKKPVTQPIQVINTPSPTDNLFT